VVSNGSLDDTDSLWRFFDALPRGVNVWKYTDGTYETTDAWPWTTDGVGKVVDIAYYGGHSYPISSGEAASLTAAGYGAYIT
jgi:hypothetical protein